jgi:hypothetical protein
MIFKACVRCRGDLYREECLGQAELVCLQCGYRSPDASASSLGRFVAQPSAARRKRVASQPIRAAA